MEEEWSFYTGGHFNGGRMVVTEMASLIEGEWSCYSGGHFNGRSMVMLRRWSV